MWKELYNKKLKNINEIMKKLPKKCIIVTGLAATESQGLLENLNKFKDHFEYVKIITCLNMKEYAFTFEKNNEGKFENHTWFMSDPTRKVKKQNINTVDFIPNNLHMASHDKLSSIKEEQLPIIFWGTVTPMHEKNGYFNLGISNVYEMDILENAEKVILEVNEKMPWIHGETQIHINQIDFIFENTWELPTLNIVEPKNLESKIAKNIASLINNGSTIQIGIGGIPNAIAKLLKDKKDLGIHTEMFTESMIELFENGVITNMKKNLWKGKFVCTFALGSKKMYEWLDNNPGIQLMRGNYVNDPYIIAKNDNMISINTAISIDLTGQVCSEGFGTKQFSGTGGQLDTHRGAIKSKNGKGIIALKSTAKNETISTIVPVLPLGSPVTVPRQDLDYVATEYGVVHLRGKSIKQRVENLISISHPKFKNDLRKKAKEYGYL
ncbi:4-hydroxybutyrate CoA-transferase [Tepiditoga spiralis]|uniref:4-hydroxybutyrate CoA-transferase n=1 Tax=Tepiditoga spiralis TaxID=2108365 RepID=A0A7G1G555_9BACT|nr:acetyl-CoA hydrolase/transferase family protein [Tepiditoga spiralis]BBE31531.1 4-hydroxybutyrate CoA-transferase [Tepiditoga spiralis]